MENDYFNSNYNVNFDTVLIPKKPQNDYIDIIEKAFYAGFITKYGSMLIFGTGAERGTFPSFINFRMQGINYKSSCYALTWFTNIYSTAQRNQGASNRKTNFYLSQRQEIHPLVDFLGVRSNLETAKEEVNNHDETHGLKEEMKKHGKIVDWQTRTKLITIPMSSKEVEIMEAVSIGMLTPNTSDILLRNGIDNGLDFLQSVFIEGTRGMVLSSDDIERINQGKRIVDYVPRAA